jgi:hypothetical protein
MPLVMTTYHELLFWSGCGYALLLELYIFKASYETLLIYDLLYINYHFGIL